MLKNKDKYKEPLGLIRHYEKVLKKNKKLTDEEWDKLTKAFLLCNDLLKEDMKRVEEMEKQLNEKC